MVSMGYHIYNVHTHDSTLTCVVEKEKEKRGEEGKEKKKMEEGKVKKRMEEKKEKTREEVEEKDSEK